MEIAICDDDNADLKIMEKLFREIFFNFEVDCNLQLFNSAAQMLKKVKRIDIAILDIAMEELNGIDLGRKLKIRFPEAHIIYTTSYRQYCMQAINEVHAFSFLCKPLKKAVVKKQIAGVLKEIHQLEDIREKTFYKVSDMEGKEFAVLRINLNDIIYFEYIKLKRKIAIILENKVYEYPGVMKKLIEELEDDGFAVNCRGILINLRHIKKIRGYDIYMDNGMVLALSQKRVMKFKEKVNSYIHEHI
ncbi:MAG: LytTR family DNA-binding domain-containing protein [Lachnospiraceae bacterium]|nr:LytTR family DNA-binding domain-containing protein [Lachnospiraceae bacterium]